MNAAKTIILASAVALMPALAQAATGRLAYTGNNEIFRRDRIRPLAENRDTTLTLWRGERASLAAMFVAGSPTGRLEVRLEPDGTPLPDGFDVHFADYVLSNSWQGCGWPSDTLPPFEVADALVSNQTSETAAGAQRPVWATIDVPRDAAPGTYRGQIIVRDRYAPADLDTLSFAVEVIDRTLPAPGDQKFYLNFWQQPYAISRYYGVEPWSDEHLELLAPYADLLARAGQRNVSAILFYEPWGAQSNDKFEPMVETILGPDGKWSYDYTVFDRYVEFMGRHGIDGEIDCFTMIPWDRNYRYFDQAAGEYRTLVCSPGSEEYASLWKSFLGAFEKHLKEKGWDQRAMISIDERSLADMQQAISIVKEAAPGLKIALAGNYHPEISDDLWSYTLTMGDPFPEGVIEERRSRGQISLYYTCCSSPEPNIFSNNNPADAAFIPVFCTANGADGYLHWAFTNWTDNPLHDTRFFMFAPGDTYCVYPGGGSSIRWERFIEGIQTSEKVRLLRDELSDAGRVDDLARLDNALAPLAGAKWADTAGRQRQYDNLRLVIASLQ
ncbi:MAG: DUF4091 domain-containing protein [Clostridium sp.]|nr:DUF4091 domain-containing protein [Clostridium sp.]